MTDKFLVIDGSSLIHRAFFALPPLMNKQGLHTGAVYGLCNMLLKLLEDVQPKYMAVAFDKSRKTFRTEMYADYKGQRKPTPPELSEQFPLSMKVLEAMNIRTLELDNYEADDIIGTFAVHAPENVEVIIVTGDRDELQLIDNRTKVYYTKRGISDIQIFDEAEFAAAYEGLVPRQLIELKGLMGDTSDNIPGVPGVGPKTALKLIKEYGDVETVLENIEKVSGKSLKTKLAENKDAAILSKKLATIYTDAPMELAMENYELKPVQESAKALLQDLEFRNMYERFAAILGGETEVFSLFGDIVEEDAAELVSVDEIIAKKLFADLVKSEEKIALYVESAGALPKLYFSKAEIFFDNKVYVLEGAEAPWQDFYKWLSDGSSLKAVCDSKELYKTCLCHNVHPQGIVDDVTLAAYLVDPGHSSYVLADLAKRHLFSEASTDCENVALLVKTLRESLEQREQVQQIPIGELFPFKNHPFKVLDDESMQRTVESVEQYGVLSPLIARPRPEGGYEIISGHRRQHAAQLAGLDNLPVIVRNMDDDAAVLLMVDSNLQRENILPSERAFAYKMKLEALKNQGARSDLTSAQVGRKLETADIVGQESGDSRNQVRRFIRLTNLIPELLDMVDEKKIAFNPAVELSHLDTNQQRDFLEAMNDTQNAPSLSQAQRLKKLAQEGHFSYDVAFAVMGEEKKDELDKVVIKNDTLRKYFPRSYTPKQMEDTIIKLLEQWQRKQQRQNER